MDHPLLRLVNESFPLTLRSDEPVRFKASAMKFETVRYDADGLGSVSLMKASGMLGMMKMETLIVNPFSKDAPLLSIDRIQAMGNQILYVEMFDTMLEPGFDVSGPEAVSEAFKAIPDNDPGEHWYDPMRVGTPFIKKAGSKEKDAMDQAQSEYLKAFLKACLAAPSCDPEAKREKAKAYSEGLLANGGPATDPVKASLGEEETAKFFRKTLFGTEA